MTPTTRPSAWIEPTEGIRPTRTNRDREAIERDGTRIVGERVVEVVQHRRYLVLERDCLQCATPFRVLYRRYEKDRRYCSDACRQKSYRERRRQRQDNTNEGPAAVKTPGSVTTHGGPHEQQYAD
jgi:hypothetical protein